MKKQVHDPGGALAPAARKKKTKKPYGIQKKRKRGRTESGRPYVEGGKKDNCTTRWW